MIKINFYRWAPLLLFLLYSGCAGSGPADDSIKMGENYNAQLGISFHNEFSGVVEYILVSKYQYKIVRAEESPREIYLETSWKDRPVFEDEAVMGVTAAQTKFVIRAKARHGGQYKLSLHGENQFQFVESDYWKPGPLSKMVKEHFDKIADDLRTEYRLLY